MINFTNLMALRGNHRAAWLRSAPLPHLIVDDFTNPEALRAMAQSMPGRPAGSRPDFDAYSLEASELRRDLLSSEFRRFLQALCQEPVFVDPVFQGGGLRAGRTDRSVMRLDSQSPAPVPGWVRRLLVLLFMECDWTPDDGGQLILQDRDGRLQTEIDPLPNRCVIIQAGDHVHCCRRPGALGQRSIVSYAYSISAASAVRPLRFANRWPALGKARAYVLAGLAGRA